ncbi:MAG TPA: DUF1697 domain-containing protein [Thermoplasmata archaeon]|nr:DUF1697 domain-containing protein [Thermoplasmata archaeon]
MDAVLLLRSANVGGRNLLKSADVVKGLAKAGIKAASQGASGNFVLRGIASHRASEAALAKLLPYRAEIIQRSGKEIARLVDSRPFDDQPAREDIKWQVSFLKSEGKILPTLPLVSPAGSDWRVNAFKLAGRDLLSRYRVVEGKPFDINRLVEKEFGVSATTRTWNTVLAIGRLLAEN